MADQENAPTEFRLTPPIDFTAEDVVLDLGPVGTMQLIKELDSKIDCWEATLLLARHFSRLIAQDIPLDLLHLTDEELEANLVEVDRNDEAAA